MDEEGKIAVESEINKNSKISKFLRDNDNLLFIGLVALVVIIRLYYFFKLGNQPIWWDEGDYLSIAKVWAMGGVNGVIPEWFGHFIGIRPLFLPLVWFVIFKIGLGETTIRFFTLLLPSIGATIFCYFLGRDLFNKKTGLIAAAMLSFYWVLNFYTYRIMTDIPAIFFGLLSLYFFWGHYIKKNKPYGLYLCFLFGVIAFATRFSFALVPISCAVYLLITRRFSLIKDKTMWKAAGLGILFLLPYLIYFVVDKFLLFQFYFGASSVSVHQVIAFWLIPFIFGLLHSLWAIALVLGIISLYPLIIYYDIVWKQKNTTFNSLLFVATFLVVHLVFFIFIFRDGNDRWLLMPVIGLFILSANGLMMAYNFVAKYNKIAGVILIGVILIGGIYQNYSHSSQLIDQKKDSYREIKEAGEWLKQNTPENSKIITASIVQQYYYSDRLTYDLHGNGTLPKDCMDKFGNIITNATCQGASENIFKEKEKIVDPDYYILSVFEPVFTPGWAYTYPQEKNLTAVKAYTTSDNQPVLIIYKY